jgi:hypothetical protein
MSSDHALPPFAASRFGGSSRPGDDGCRALRVVQCVATGFRSLSPGNSIHSDARVCMGVNVGQSYSKDLMHYSHQQLEE